jgi:2-oxoglutarate/2-oxoacid ferredoxin oxidoreductase subunit alpha
MAEHEREVKFMSGNEAVAFGALYAGCRFFAGYPITPSSEIAEVLARELPLRDGVFIQMEDEIAAMAAIIGASLAGRKSLTATSGPGFSLKQENLGYAWITEIPCVVANVQRGGPSTGAPTSPSQQDMMQARWGTHGDHEAVALCPDSVQESFSEAVRAFNLAEQFRVPVILLTDEVIGHAREKIVLPRPGELAVVERKKPTVSPEEYLPYDDRSGDVPPMANFGEGYRYHVTGLNHDATGFPTNSPELTEAAVKRMQRKLLHHLDQIVEVERIALDDAKAAVVAYGATARSAKEAVKMLRAEGKKAGLLRLKTIWPFPVKEIEALARAVSCILVPEMNIGQMVLEVERVAARHTEVEGLGRADNLMVTPAQIAQRLRPHL